MISRFAICSAVLSLLAGPSSLMAQAADEFGPPSWMPSAAFGPSWFLLDFWEDDPNSTGATLRLGAELPGVGVGLGLSRWPDVGGFRLTAAQLEMDFTMVEGRTFSPHLLAAVGYTTGRYLGTGPSSPPDGASAAYGIGFKLRPHSRLGVRTDAAIRTDDGGWNAEVRILGGWMPAPESAGGDARVEGDVFWMVPVAGPWEFVEPGYSVGIVRPWSDRLAAALSLSVIHWQIPSPVQPRGYLWDTRMFMAVPALEWSSGALPIRARFGPAIAAMGEGPDRGANVGAHARAFWTVDVLDLSLQAGVGGLWLSFDGAGDSRAGGSDQVGLTVSAGVRF